MEKRTQGTLLFSIFITLFSATYIFSDFIPLNFRIALFIVETGFLLYFLYWLNKNTNFFKNPNPNLKKEILRSLITIFALGFFILPLISFWTGHDIYALLALPSLIIAIILAIFMEHKNLEPDDVKARLEIASSSEASKFGIACCIVVLLMIIVVFFTTGATFKSRGEFFAFLGIFIFFLVCIVILIMNVKEKSKIK